MREVTDLVVATQLEHRLPLWLTHIWQRQHSHKKLGLILGAGVSIDAGCPAWADLVERLAAKAISKSPGKSSVIAAHRNARLTDTYITQILYHFHRQDVASSGISVPDPFAPFQIDSSWMALVHEELFKDLASISFEDILKKHTYLEALGVLAAGSALTVNFNFDDLVDEAAIRATGASNTESPEIIYRPKTDTRRNAPIIYHINGLLPREKERRKSDFLTFTEDAFADVLISSGSPHSEFMMSRFSNTTFLLLGTSLNDNSLKNMLRAGIKRNPANHHYIVYWESASSPRTAEEKEDIFAVNLEVYNLISIFLPTAAISQFLNLINEPDGGAFEADILRLTNPSAPSKTRRRYYLVGSVAAGKSTNLEALRCFTTFEEWLGRTPATLYQDHKTLNAAQRAEIDGWVYGQLRAKNDRMKTTLPGIYVMDRGYLDLFAFSETDAENVVKADELRNRVKFTSGSFEDGEVILLKADEKTLARRQASRGKLAGATATIDYDGAKLVAQGDVIEKIYKPNKDSIFDTSDEDCDITAKSLARHILLDDYRPFDFESRIDEIKNSGGTP